MKPFYDCWRKFGMTFDRDYLTWVDHLLVWFALLFAIFCFISKAWSEPLRGPDILGLAKQPISMIAQEVPPNTVVGVLAGTFGPVIKPLERLINESQGRVIGYRGHLGNGTCLRNRVCGPGEFAPNDFKTMRKRASDFHDLNLRHPELKCFLSPYLEHDEKNKATVNRWVKIIREAAPECTVVISAFTGFRPKGPGILQEYHGNNAKGDVISNDGVSLFDSNSPKYRDQGSIIVFGWIHRFNLRVSGEKSFTPPQKRKWQVTRDNMIQVRRLLQPEESKPVVAGCKDIAKPNLWKSNSEDYGTNPDGRGDRPLFISSKKINQYQITDIGGSTVGCASYFGNFDGGGYRYYAGSCSGNSAITLMDKAKSEWVLLKGGGQCFLSNTIRRKGYFR